MPVLGLPRAAEIRQGVLSVDLFRDGAHDLDLQAAVVVDRRATFPQRHLGGAGRKLEGLDILSDPARLASLEALHARLVIFLRITEVGDVFIVVIPFFREVQDRTQRVGVRSRRLHHSVVVDLVEGQLLGKSLMVREDFIEPQIMVRVRMGDHDRHVRRRRLGIFQVEPPAEEAEHVLLFARVDDEMLVVGGDDMASVALAHVDEIDLEHRIGQQLGLQDDAVAPAAGDPDVLLAAHLDPAVVAGAFQDGRDDPVAVNQLVLELHGFFPRLRIGNHLVQLYRREGGIAHL